MSLCPSVWFPVLFFPWFWVGRLDPSNLEPPPPTNRLFSLWLLGIPGSLWSTGILPAGVELRSRNRETGISGKKIGAATVGFPNIPVKTNPQIGQERAHLGCKFGEVFKRLDSSTSTNHAGTLILRQHHFMTSCIYIDI